MRVWDKDMNHLTSLPDELKVNIKDILMINDEIYIIESIERDNVKNQTIVRVDTLLNHKLHNHVLEFTYDYYTPEELQEHLRKVGLEIKLMDIDNIKDYMVVNECKE